MAGRQFPTGYFPKNVTLLKCEDINIINGEVHTPLLMELARIKRSANQFKNDVLFTQDMSANDVRRTLEEAFPVLINKSFSCAAREENGRLAFHGVRGVWNGNHIKRKARGTALYIILEAEAPVIHSPPLGTESSASASGTTKDNYGIKCVADKHHEPVQVRGRATIATDASTDLSRSPVNPIQTDKVDSVTTYDDMPSDLEDVTPGHFNVDLKDMMGEIEQEDILQLKRLHLLDSTEDNGTMQNTLVLHQGQREAVVTAAVSDGGLKAASSSGESLSQDQAFIKQSTPSEGMKPSKGSLQLHQVPATAATSRGGSKAAFSSGESLSQDQALGKQNTPNVEISPLKGHLQLHRTPATAAVSIKRSKATFLSGGKKERLSQDQALGKQNSPVVKINPPKGPLQGGGSFCLEFDKIPRDPVTSGLAIFEEKPVKLSKTHELQYVLHGKCIPARETPGTVPVIITTETGDYLGETQYTYVDQTKELMKEMVSNKRKLSELFYNMAKLFKSDDCIENKTQGSQDVGLPNQEKQLQPVDILLPLVYAAAETGAKQFIEIFFCLPVAKMVFEEYKNNFVLPEHIAEGNGHEEIATYLRDITKRFSEEDGKNQTQSKKIDWLELAKAFEESSTQLATNGDEFAGSSCQNAATCVNLVGSYHCEGGSGCTGSNCETVSIREGKVLSVNEQDEKQPECEVLQKNKFCEDLPELLQNAVTEYYHGLTAKSTICSQANQVDTTTSADVIADCFDVQPHFGFGVKRTGLSGNLITRRLAHGVLAVAVVTYLILTLLAIANGSHCNNKTEVELYNPRDHSFSHCWPAPDCHDGQEPSVRPGLSYPKDTDIECRKCPDGSFSNIKNNYTCQQCTVCLNKEVLLNCTPGRDTVCSNRCISSEFYFNVTDQQCYPCTECCGAYHGNIEPQCISLRIGEVIGEKGPLHCKMRSSQRCDKLFLKNNASSGTNRSTNNVPVVESLTKKCSWSLDNLPIGLICGVVSLTVVLVLMIGLWKRERERRSLRNDYLPSPQQCPLISNCLPGSASPTGGGCSGGCDIPCQEKLKVIPEEVKIDDIPYDVEELIIKLDAKRPHLKNWYDVGRKLGVSPEDLEQLKREDDREGGSPTRCLLSLLRTYEEIVSLRTFVHVLYDLRRSDLAKRICEFYKGNRNTAV